MKTRKILALLQEVFSSLSLSKGANHRELNIVSVLRITNNLLKPGKRGNLQVGHYVRRCTTVYYAVAKRRLFCWMSNLWKHSQTYNFLLLRLTISIQTCHFSKAATLLALGMSFVICLNQVISVKLHLDQ